MEADTSETPVNQAATETPETCRRLSELLIKNLLIYDLKPTELKLALILYLDTFLQNRFSAPIQLERWTRELRFRDSRGWRMDKTAAIFTRLRELFLIDANEGEAVFQLRPDILNWSKLRNSGSAVSQTELKLCAERPLDEALSSISRENALARGGDQVLDPDAAALFAKLKEMLNGNCSQLEVDNFYDELRRKNPTKVRQISPKLASEKSDDSKSPGKPALFDASEKSDAPIAIAKACTDLKAIAKASEKSDAEGASKAWDWLMSIDRKGWLKSSQYSKLQWWELCQADYRYVLNRLRGKFDQHNSRVNRKEPGLDPIQDPLAWLSRSCWDEKKFRRA